MRLASSQEVPTLALSNLSNFKRGSYMLFLFLRVPGSLTSFIGVLVRVDLIKDLQDRFLEALDLGLCLFINLLSSNESYFSFLPLVVSFEQRHDARQISCEFLIRQLIIVLTRPGSFAGAIFNDSRLRIISFLFQNLLLCSFLDFLNSRLIFQGRLWLNIDYFSLAEDNFP